MRSQCVLTWEVRCVRTATERVQRAERRCVFEQHSLWAECAEVAWESRGRATPLDTAGGPLYSVGATLFCWGPLYSAEGPLYSVGATLLCCGHFILLGGHSTLLRGHFTLLRGHFTLLWPFYSAGATLLCRGATLLCWGATKVCSTGWLAMLRNQGT